MIYEISGQKMVDFKTIIEITNYKKSSLQRLLNKREVPYFTYKNRRIYSLSALTETLGDKIDIDNFNNYSLVDPVTKKNVL